MFGETCTRITRAFLVRVSKFHPGSGGASQASRKLASSLSKKTFLQQTQNVPASSRASGILKGLLVHVRSNFGRTQWYTDIATLRRVFISFSFQIVMLCLAHKLEAKQMGFFTKAEWLKGMTELQ